MMDNITNSNQQFYKNKKSLTVIDINIICNAKTNKNTILDFKNLLIILHFYRRQVKNVQQS